jgi:hypothetical protein
MAVMGAYPQIPHRFSQATLGQRHAIGLVVEPLPQLGHNRRAELLTEDQHFIGAFTAGLIFHVIQLPIPGQQLRGWLRMIVPRFEDVPPRMTMTGCAHDPAVAGEGN